jgi:hypothetical protein
MYYISMVSTTKTEKLGITLPKSLLRAQLMISVETFPAARISEGLLKIT